MMSLIALSYKENSLFPFDIGYTAISVQLNLHGCLDVCVCAAAVIKNIFSSKPPGIDAAL